MIVVDTDTKLATRSVKTERWRMQFALNLQTIGTIRFFDDPNHAKVRDEWGARSLLFKVWVSLGIGR
jgi:hypothetical protein